MSALGLIEVDVLHEFPVDLDHCGFEGQQVLQAGVSGPCIIHRNHGAGCPEGIQIRFQGDVGVDGRLLRHLDDQTAQSVLRCPHHPDLG
jgi:hypothetical protein